MWVKKWDDCCYDGSEETWHRGGIIWKCKRGYGASREGNKIVKMKDIIEEVFTRSGGA